MIADPALALFDAICALSDRPAKRFRAASSRSNKTKAADRDPDASKKSKRAKTDESNPIPHANPNEDEQKTIELIMSQIEPILPRVGKRINQNSNKCYNLFFPPKKSKGL